MKKQIYYRVLILSVIFSLGIASASDNNTNDSSSHVRKKRLIDRTSDGNRPVSIHQVNYIVNLEENGVHACSGSILSEYLIVTAAHCVERDSRYTVKSGSSHVKRGITHHVIRILRYPGSRPYSFQGDFSLLTIIPAINLIRSPNRIISIFEGHVPPNTHLSTSGWGFAVKRGVMDCLYRGPASMGFPKQLRSITLPTISIEECRNEHGGDNAITNEVICTFDRSRQKRCGVGDGGNPLVHDGQLVGLLGWNPPGSPDVFVNLAFPEYREWIILNLPHPHSPLHVNPHVPPPSPESSISSHSSSRTHSTFSPKTTSPHSPHIHVDW